VVLAKMKIMHVVNFFDPRLGYAEFYISKKQQDFGFEVCVVSSVFPPYGNQRWLPGLNRLEGIDVFQLRSACRFRDNILFFDPFSLRKIIKNFSPDVIHCHGLLSPLSQMVLMLKGSCGCKVVGDVITGISPFASQLFPAFKRFFNFLILGKVDALFACNRAVEKFLVEDLDISSLKVHLIPLGADVELFRPDRCQREETRKLLQFSSKDVVLIYTGKFLQSKRIHDLLKASKPVIDKNSNFKLLLIGDGPASYGQRLQLLIGKLGIENNVLLMKTVHRTELPRFYNAADFAVWPGSFSISIIEAMACGLPIIIAKSDWTSHYLEYKNGCSFKAGDINHLSSIMLRVSLDSSLRKSMGFGSRKMVEDKLNWHAIVNQYNAVYTKVVTNSNL
jgi:glycosyltransferase involved in cell wall biosynthesis